MGVDCCSEENKDQHEVQSMVSHTQKKLSISVDSQDTLATAHETPTFGDLKGKREKKPRQTFFDGTMYDGEWLGGKRDGKGQELQIDGSQYDGNWK